MTLFRVLRRQLARVLAPLAMATALLAACGGGTSQVQTFTPARLIVFGDENSRIENDGNNDGFKYSINDRSATTDGKCLALPNFAQILASRYGFVFAECNPTALTPRAFILAMRGAKADDATTGLAQQVATLGNLNNRDLVTVMIGSNDVIELYEQVQSGMLISDAVAEAQRRGAVVAAQVNAILKTGARALVFTIPDLGSSPYAANASKTDPGAAGLLSNLTTQFNAYLRTGIDSNTYDGRNYGLVFCDEVVAAMINAPGAYLSSPYDMTDPACVVNAGDPLDTVDTAVLACNTTNLVSGASSSSYLWASDRHLGPVAHTQIGNQGLSRLIALPF